MCMYDVDALYHLQFEGYYQGQHFTGSEASQYKRSTCKGGQLFQSTDLIASSQSAIGG